MSGKRLTESEYRQAAEENLAEAIKKSSFTLDDRIGFYKKKWLKEHIAGMVFLGICIAGVFIMGLVLKNSLIVSGAVLMLTITHGWRNNTMMAYVERNAYDGKGLLLHSDKKI